MLNRLTFRCPSVLPTDCKGEQNQTWLTVVWDQRWALHVWAQLEQYKETMTHKCTEHTTERAAAQSGHANTNCMCLWWVGKGVSWESGVCGWVWMCVCLCICGVFAVVTAGMKEWRRRVWLEEVPTSKCLFIFITLSHTIVYPCACIYVCGQYVHLCSCPFISSSNVAPDYVLYRCNIEHQMTLIFTIFTEIFIVNNVVDGLLRMDWV